jgi:hypothetical protein
VVLRLRAEERLLVAVAGRLVVEPVTVAAVGQCSDLVAGEPDEVALAREPFVAEPRQRLGLAAIRPLGDQRAGRTRTGRSSMATTRVMVGSLTA